MTTRKKMTHEAGARDRSSAATKPRAGAGLRFVGQGKPGRLRLAVSLRVRVVRTATLALTLALTARNVRRTTLALTAAISGLRLRGADQRRIAVRERGCLRLVPLGDRSTIVQGDVAARVLALAARTLPLILDVTLILDATLVVATLGQRRRREGRGSSRGIGTTRRRVLPMVA